MRVKRTFGNGVQTISGLQSLSSFAQFSIEARDDVVKLSPDIFLEQLEKKSVSSTEAEAALLSTGRVIAKRENKENILTSYVKHLDAGVEKWPKAILSLLQEPIILCELSPDEVLPLIVKSAGGSHEAI